MKQPIRAARTVKELLDISEQLNVQSRELNAKCSEQSRHLADILNQSKEVSTYYDVLKTRLGDRGPRRRSRENEAGPLPEQEI